MSSRPKMSWLFCSLTSYSCAKFRCISISSTKTSSLHSATEECWTRLLMSLMDGILTLKIYASTRWILMTLEFLVGSVNSQRSFLSKKMRQISSIWSLEIKKKVCNPVQMFTALLQRCWNWCRWIPKVSLGANWHNREAKHSLQTNTRILLVVSLVFWSQWSGLIVPSFLNQSYTWSRLQISEEHFRKLFTCLKVHPNFLDIVYVFREKVRPLEESFSGFFINRNDQGVGSSLAHDTDYSM